MFHFNVLKLDLSYFNENLDFSMMLNKFLLLSFVLLTIAGLVLTETIA